jgi:O-acetylhomoserine/O-acetylserine sulfhydrylase-like pyridoxal-dependent enzyme
MIETTAPASPVPDAENELSPGVAAWVERGEALTAAEEARKATMRRARFATIPAISTHQQQGEAGRSLAAVPEGSIRLSVGGEHPDDLIADLDRALDPEVVR